jgi:hypothetical protein
VERRSAVGARLPTDSAPSPTVAVEPAVSPVPTAAWPPGYGGVVRSARQPPLRPKWRLLGWIALVFWCAVSEVAVSVASGTVVTEVVVVPCALLAPGLALALFLRLRGFALNATLVILVGIAVGVIVPSILLYSGAWSPDGAFAIVVGGTVAAAVGGLASSIRSLPLGRAGAPADSSTPLPRQGSARQVESQGTR